MHFLTIFVDRFSPGLPCHTVLEKMDCTLPVTLMQRFQFTNQSLQRYFVLLCLHFIKLFDSCLRECRWQTFHNTFTFQIRKWTQAIFWPFSLAFPLTGITHQKKGTPLNPLSCHAPAKEREPKYQTAATTQIGVFQYLIRSRNSVPQTSCARIRCLNTKSGKKFSYLEHRCFCSSVVQHV